MSKIIEALEKAKRDGTLEHSQGTLDERDTVAPLHPVPSDGRTSRPPGRRRQRSHSHLLVATQVPPEVIEAVEAHVEVLRNPMSVVTEQYRALRNRLERLNLEGHLQTIAVTSAAKGEGKSLTALNLSLVLAQDGTKRVLLVDADLRRPKVHKLLGFDAAPGLGDFLAGRVGGEGVLRHTPFHGLTVVTAGTVEGHPSELLASPEFEEWVAARRREYDYVFFDTPPVHPVSDVNFLASSVDGILVVVRAGKTPKGLVKHAVEALPAKKLLGAVLNRAESIGPGYGYGYGKGDYYKYY